MTLIKNFNFSTEYAKLRQCKKYPTEALVALFYLLGTNEDPSEIIQENDFFYSTSNRLEYSQKLTIPDEKQKWTIC